MDDSNDKQPSTEIPENFYNMMYGNSPHDSESSKSSENVSESEPSESSSENSASSAIQESTNSSSASGTNEPDDASSSSSSSSSTTSSAKASSSASEAEREASAEARNKQLRAKDDEDFANETESIHDSEPEGETKLRKAKDDLEAYIKETSKSSDDPKETESRLDKLASAQSDLIHGIQSFEAEYNHTILRLRKQLDDVDQIQRTYQDANPQESLDILKDWARTGMPSRIEHSYQKLAWVVNTPEFKAFLRDNKGENFDDTAIPKATQSRFESEKSDDQKIAQAKSAKSASSSKGSNK